jgi:hypothetical protein
MQTSIWITYSYSTHFSDKISYKILFISRYDLKDMNLTSFAYLQELWRKKNINNWDGPDLSSELLPAAPGEEEGWQHLGQGPSVNGSE